jgi:hypothetical protein
MSTGNTDELVQERDMTYKPDTARLGKSELSVHHNRVEQSAIQASLSPAQMPSRSCDPWRYKAYLQYA